MPVIVDSGQRRAEVVRAAVGLIIRDGLDGLTFRGLAGALGCSTTVISHYFRDKNDLLLETYRFVTAQAMARRDRALACADGDLLLALEALLPVCDEQRGHWTVWLCFWSSALFAPDLYEAHRSGLAGTRERLRTFLESRGLADGAEAAQSVCSALFGIAVQALFDVQYWTEARQRSAFRRAVEAALADRPASARLA
jgi:AcrR family transcriptional regulator